MHLHSRRRIRGPLAAATLTIALSIALTAAALTQRASSQTSDTTRAYDTSRIVSIGGAITEILFELGVADRIVAVDTTSLHPAGALKTKPNVGYLRALSTEGVLSLMPTLLIASDKAGPPEVVRALKASSVGYLEVDEDPTPAALIARVGLLAKAMGSVVEGNRLSNRIAADFMRLHAAVAAIEKPRSALFILTVQSGRLMVGGRGTSADAMIALAGARNIAAEFHGFKPMTMEAVLNANPDAIVIMTRSSGTPVRDELNRLPGVMATTAGREARIIEMDGLLLLGFGPRTPEAAAILMNAIYARDGSAYRNGKNGL